MLTCFTVANCLAYNNVGDVNAGPVINIRVEIGLIPLCSWKWSICDIDITVDGSGSSQVISGNGGSSWIISIPRETLLKEYPKALEKLDGKTTVSFESDFKGSEELKRALGTYKDLMIQANATYPLRYENGNYIITVKL